ncbi:hypothetical protein EMIHUDRAFT_221800 [Emiliania huxleyi CCMP1516]|uniref:Coenzyme Q-binding protein COQ10 START domain-containing protein n=2 Tax=Emiliania huxleyi TaxID=2903 RepID=A0A0D3HXF3_EMIH1|nr:hypothetical protein EMIHUDRAFT_221800 [Emiliania huxleyi CCMP1516]EOD03688.1 hypothetical protein EMIHUDRAFT_221800 [Emiliania huxleyi CCMP1516]|eukprot:XP_005756117.1 hypothetical protein EMIHUDRAFT_221800 [Emiliania huxleyi CCMP1516]
MRPSSSICLQLAIGLAIAAALPCLVENPLLGLVLSGALNVALLLRVRQLELKLATLERSTPACASQTPDTALRVQHQQSLAVPLPRLNAVEAQRLARGETVLKSIGQGGDGKEGLAAVMIEAPAELVWATLLDFGSWPSMVDNVTAADVYENSGADIKVRVVIGVGLLKITSHVHHVLDRLHNQLTWTLDPSKPSDLVQNTGHWLLREEPARPNSTAARVSLSAWAPAWLGRFIAAQGLPRATAWLKRESERRFAAGGAWRGSLRRRELAAESQQAPEADGVAQAIDFGGGGSAVQQADGQLAPQHGLRPRRLPRVASDADLLASASSRSRLMYRHKASAFRHRMRHF